MAQNQLSDQPAARHHRGPKIDNWRLSLCEQAQPEVVAELLFAYRVLGCVEARDRLVQAHLRLVAYFANRYARNRASFDDLMSEGSIALLKAIDRFDFDRGVPFTAYATVVIRKTLRGLAADSTGEWRETDLLDTEPASAGAASCPVGRLQMQDDIEALLKGLDAIPHASAQALCTRFGIRRKGSGDAGRLPDAPAKPVRDLPAFLNRAIEQLRTAVDSARADRPRAA